MKHPLTSKERKGLVAVAAAALLSISSGFIFRSCRNTGGGAGEAPVRIEEVDSVSVTEAYSRGKRGKTDRGSSIGKGKKKGNGNKNSRSPKTFPERDPLSEPCD